ncbi:MAG: transposase [Bryobacterales bacterium]
MPRQAHVAAGVPHHITQRGNNRQEVFLVDEDRRFYLDHLRDQARHHGVRLPGYCLMSNPVHLVAVPERPDGLARALGQLHGRYAWRFNRRYRRSGHLWQNRFYSCPLAKTHLWRALLYVDLNPVRAGLGNDPAAYPWSSAAAHSQGGDPSGLLDSWEWSELDPGAEWAEFLAARTLGLAEAMALREATYSGRPLGEEAFVSRLETELGRSLQAKPRGRPPQSQSATRAARQG